VFVLDFIIVLMDHFVWADYTFSFTVFLSVSAKRLAVKTSNLLLSAFT